MKFRKTKKPLLYEINTRVWLSELSRRAGREWTLADVPQEEIDRITDLGVDLVWLMGVWQVGPTGEKIARDHAGLDREYRQVLQDFTPEDVWGSPYAVSEYSVDLRLGGREALGGLRRKLGKRGVGLVLDFVPNHTGLDHSWIGKRPEFYVQGGEEDLEREPENFFAVETASGRRVLAHGKDPYFPGWTDTAQLNYLHRPARRELENVLSNIAGQCDGVRCDMAMLVLEEVFHRVWGDTARRTAGIPPAEGEFWSEAIDSIRSRHPHFLFLAEAYWGMGGQLQMLGFDYTYDKALYDLLLHEGGSGVRTHLRAPLMEQTRAARFLENHDEPRAQSAFPWDQHRAAAVIIGTVPGMAILHEGQLEGRRMRVPVQLGRRPAEPILEEVQSFYRRLLHELRNPAFRNGRWRLLEVCPAWEGNPSFENFLAYRWEDPGGSQRFIAVNYSSHRGQCYVRCGCPEWEGRTVELVDLLGEGRYRREGSELREKGLYLDMPGFGFHLFDVLV